MGTPDITVVIAPTDPVGSSQSFTAAQSVVLPAGDFTVLASAVSPNGMSQLTLTVNHAGQATQVATVTDSVDANGLVSGTLRILGANGAAGSPIAVHLVLGDTTSISADAYSTSRLHQNLTLKVQAAP